jgi:membrane fusion protein
VKSISPTPVEPETIDGLKLEGPIFIVKVELGRDLGKALRKKASLKPGVLLQADILLDKRSLIEWILDPFLRSRGKK